VGGTKKGDVERGRVQSLLDPAQARSTIMKLSQISSLWDYINRAMPWNNPRTLSTEEVYALTAYILNLAELVPDDFVLSERNIAQVQARLPNRAGMTTHHGLWDTKGKPDVQASACMTNCAGSVTVASVLPEHARDAHGNLADQQRVIGPVRGVMTARTAQAAAPSAAATVDVRAIATQNACLACHGVDQRVVGPSFREIAAKYQGDANAATHVAVKVKNGGVGTWGQVPMPAQGHVKDEQIKQLVDWILAGAK
jgi:cytochrome c551/c552